MRCATPPPTSPPPPTTTGWQEWGCGYRVDAATRGGAGSGAGVQAWKEDGGESIGWEEKARQEGKGDKERSTHSLTLFPYPGPFDYAQLRHRSFSLCNGPRAAPLLLPVAQAYPLSVFQALGYCPGCFLPPGHIPGHRSKVL